MNVGSRSEKQIDAPSRFDLEDLHYSLVHEASIDGPDLILDGERYEGMYAAGDAWVALAVRAPSWIRQLLEERQKLRVALGDCAKLNCARPPMGKHYKAKDCGLCTTCRARVALQGVTA